jgi:hypothetical protein
LSFSRISAMALPRSRPSSRAVTPTSCRKSSRRNSTWPGSSETSATCDSFTVTPLGDRIGGSRMAAIVPNRVLSTSTRMLTTRSPSSTLDVLSPSSAVFTASGCHSTLHVAGSKSSGVFAEDGLIIGVYNYLHLEKEPPPSTSELIFDLDAAGVTPIFTWGKTEGRVNFPVPDEQRNGGGTCRLQINLLALPPSGDILLIGSANPCKGAFTDLPEGGIVRATFAGKTYAIHE